MLSLRHVTSLESKPRLSRTRQGDGESDAPVSDLQEDLAGEAAHQLEAQGLFRSWHEASCRSPTTPNARCPDGVHLGE